MAKDLADTVGTAIGRVAREAGKSLSTNARKRANGSLSGSKGVAAGLGLAALAPVAAKGVGKIARKASPNGAGPSKLAGKAAGGLKDAVGDKAAKGVKDAVADKVPGAGKSGGMPGVGKGRRMPIQQDIDIGVPLKTVYNQWTQFEEWPNFMHRLQRVTQEDDTHVSFKTKIWGVSREFTAEIVEQQPDKRIKWEVTDGVSHSGVVTFHELAPTLTRVEVNLDVQPGSLLEKAARGMRHIKRAVRADLARFKAYVLMEDEETGAWRGAIEDGDVKRSTARSSGGSSGRSRAASSRSRSRSSSHGRNGSSGSGRSGSSGSGGSRSAATARKSSSSSARKSSPSSRKNGSGSSAARKPAANGRKSSS